MEKDDKKGKNKRKIKYLIIGYVLLFIFLSISYLLDNKFVGIWSYEIMYFSVIYFLTLPFILGIDVPKKKIVYPLYILIAIAVSWFTYNEVYLYYSLFTMFAFVISVTPMLYPKVLNEKLRKVLRVIIPLIFLSISIFLIFQELTVSNNYTDSDTDSSYNEKLEIPSTFIGNYKTTFIDNEKNAKEIRLVVSDEKTEFEEELFSDSSNYYNTTLDIYENETLKKQYYLLNKSYFDGKLTFECLGSSDSDNPSKFDKTLLGISVDLNFSNNTYTMSINFITNTYSNVILSKVGAFDDTTKYTNAKEYYFYDIDGKSYSYTFNEPSEDKTVLSHYICNTNDCNLYVSDNYFAVIRDDKYYYVYNVKTGNIINSFSKEEKYSVTSIVTKNNFPSGVILQYHKDSKTRVSYYDFYYGKETIDDKMCDYIYKSISDNYLYCSKDGSTNLVNTKGELVKEEINNSVSDDNGNVYFYESHHTSQGLLVKKLYDKDFNVIYTEKNDDEKLQYYNLIPDGDSITFATNKKFYTYNGNSKSYESKEEYKEIYRIFNNHAVVNKDGYATIIDYNEKVITTLCKLTTENQVKEVYMNDEDNVIIVYVSDPNITASDIEETVYNKDVINNKEMFEKYKEGRTFYKYNYYINESRIEKKADFI